MKIAITAQANSLSSPLDPRFGRAAGFILVDTETSAHQFFDNTQNMELAQGAGLQAAQNVADTGASAVITGHVGPKAFTALSHGKIDVYYTQSATVEEALKAFQSGQLSKAATADKPGHW